MKELKGQLLTNIAPVFIAALIAVIMLFLVLMPITNGVLAGNGTCQPGATCSWNQTGYASALLVAQQTPILFILALFIGIALVVIKLVGGV